MEIKTLKQRQDIENNSKLNAAYLQFKKLLNELRKRELPDTIVASINKDIDVLNSDFNSEKELRKKIKQKQTEIIKLIEKELKLVTKNHYRTLWLAVGMAAFGIPLGVVFGISLGNMAYLGIGLPIGLAFGIALGTKLDKKACEEGRQLDLEIKQ